MTLVAGMSRAMPGTGVVCSPQIGEETEELHVFDPNEYDAGNEGDEPNRPCEHKAGNDGHKPECSSCKRKARRKKIFIFLTTGLAALTSLSELVWYLQNIHM
ncbi:hypothetical protein [uncultured Pseudonocardia sp.]|uniref:hypothetical protein n=1 Tax=uncultured Pseudonocardia sp. TaxID=211455 RepID=UPI002637088E|nr:hypothetical protein [uncultured Pseudonocardia sp.]